MLQVEQIKAARVLLGWDQSELASRAGIALSTVKRLEARPGIVGGTMDTIMRIRTTMERAGIIFIAPDETAGPGVRLAKTP